MRADSHGQHYGADAASCHVNLHHAWARRSNDGQDLFHDRGTDGAASRRQGGRLGLSRRPVAPLVTADRDCVCGTVLST